MAKYQQWVLYALLANIVINVMAMSTRGADVAVSLGLAVLALAIVVISMFAIFSLAKEVYGIGVGVVCALLMVVPCVSLLTLLVVNGKATSILQQGGIKVGFMGVSPDKI